MNAALTPKEFAAILDVSRETLGRLQVYLELLKRWQRAINLVGNGTLNDPWRRHLLDSAQLMALMPVGPGHVYDLGSGGGLPGLVLAIMGRRHVHLVETDRRKAQFLLEAARTLDLDVTVHACRIEALPRQCATILTARALAPLPRLLDLAFPLLAPSGQCLFLKGRGARDELTQTSKCWRMSAEFIPSLSDPEASILQLRDIERAPLHRA